MHTNDSESRSGEQTKGQTDITDESTDDETTTNHNQQPKLRCIEGGRY